MAAVMSADLPRAGREGAVPLMLPEFVGSVARLAWAKAGAYSFTLQLNLSRV